jgi:protein-disulfide isomerase
MGRGRRQDRLRQRRQERADQQADRAAAAEGPRRARPGWQRAVDRVGGLAVVASVGAALLLVVVLVWVNRPAAPDVGGEFTPTPRTTVEGRIEGDPDAPVRIIEFSDFQCAFCAQFARETHPHILDEYVETGYVSLQYHHMAFLGEESFRAAEAAECALDQGRFWDMHDILFQRQGQPNSGVYSDANLRRFAREIAEHYDDFDVAEFDRCLDSGEKRPIVEEMSGQASQAGVQSTPSFLINTQGFAGAQPIEVFRQVIEEELDRMGEAD